MRSLSNVIKAYNIRYTDEKKPIDMNKRAEEFQRLYLENLPKFKEIDANTEQELQESYFLTEGEDDGSSLTSEGFSEFSESAKSKLQTELKQLREAAEEECRLLRMQAEEECQSLVMSSAERTEEERVQILNDAKSSGYEAGRQQAMKEAEVLRDELLQKQNALEAEYQRRIESMEPDIAEIIIGAVKNLTGILLEDQKGIIMHLVRRTMLGAENSNRFIIRVSKDDYEFVNTRRQELCNEFAGKRLEIIRDPMLSRAQCTIETDSRIIDCSLDVQLKNLTLDLKLLAGML